MAVLAALGGVSSTYINTIGDIFQAMLGFPGATQWAAGFHVLWLIMAYGIIRKPGTGVVTGLLKGAVELMSGNTHGVIILLVNLIAGLIIDIVFFLFQNRKSLWANILAGGFASASNVFVFQIFATLPSDILAYSFLGILGMVAFASGVIFAALLSRVLLAALNKAGVVKESLSIEQSNRYLPAVLIGLVLISAGLAVYFRITLQGPASINILGSVSEPISFPSKDNKMPILTKSILYRNIPTNYSGYLLKDVVNLANPSESAAYLLIRAKDGYSFLLSFDELSTNENILLSPQGQGSEKSFDIVGPTSSKAWIMGVLEMVVVAESSLEIKDADNAVYQFVPEQWQSEMDSILLTIDGKSQKVQGVPLGMVLEASDFLTNANTLVITSDQTSLEFNITDLLNDDSIRLFVIIGETDITYALAKMNGEVLAFPFREILLREND